MPGAAALVESFTLCKRGTATPMRPGWDSTFVAMADQMSHRSLCDGRQIGAIIVDSQNRIVATGYNGPPAGFDHQDLGCRQWCPRMMAGGERTLDYSNCLSSHAEMNALAVADRRSYEGGTIYVTSSMCWDCGKVVANSGVQRVVMRVMPADKHRNPQRTIDFLQECGLEVKVIS